jgi:hypothetical protein
LAQLDTFFHAQLVNAIFRAGKRLEAALQGPAFQIEVGDLQEDWALFSVGLVTDGPRPPLRYYRASLSPAKKSSSLSSQSWGLRVVRLKGPAREDEFDRLLRESLEIEASAGVSAVQEADSGASCEEATVTLQ